MNLLMLMTIAVLLAGGMGVALLGSVKLALARKLQIDEARVGGLISMFGLALIPVILSVGFVTDLIGKQPVVVGGSVLMALSLAVLGAARKYWHALVGVLLLSASWAALVNVVNPMAAIAFGGSKAYAMNMACFVFGGGAFLTPLAIAFFLRRGSLARALLLLAGFLVVPVALALSVDFSTLDAAAQAPGSAGAPAAGMASLLADPVMWLCALAFLFLFPLEAATGAWTTTYLSEHGLSEGAASGMLSAFWLIYTASRLVTALSVKVLGLPPGGEAVLILVFAVAAVAVLSGIVWARGRAMAIVMILAAGLIFAPIFPTIMAVLLGHFEPAVHGRAVGLLFAIGGIGTVTIPAAMGAYAKRTCVQRGFLISIGSAVCLTVLALNLVLRG